MQSAVLDDGTTSQPARLAAPGGQINLGQHGFVRRSSFSNPEIGSEHQWAIVHSEGNINLSEEALLDVSADAAGTVRIRGGELVIDQAMISADTVNANGASAAIDIQTTEKVSIAHTDVSGLTATTTGAGSAGE